MMRRPRRASDAIFSVNFPFAPARLPFFYGWVVVLVSSLGMVLSIPGQTMGVSVFTDFLIRDLGVSRSALSSAYMGGTIASACCLPLAGRFFDRCGARSMIVISSLGLGTTLLFLSASERIAGLVARRAPELLAPPTAALAVLCVGFFLLRFWGQGVLAMVSRAMLGKWFDRRRGLASALSGVLVAAAFAGAPVFLLTRISARGWRGAWVELAVVCAVWALLGWLFYRDNPEECGLEMDGGSDESPGGSRGAPFVRDFTLSEVLRGYPFWVAGLSLALFGLAITGVTFHVTSIGAKAGLSERDAVAIFIPMAVVSVASNFASGWLSDRAPIRTLVWTFLGAQTVGSAALLQFAAPAGRLFVVLGFGVAGGLFTVLTTVMWPRFYGRVHLGAISAVSMAMTVFGSALGPKIFALAEARDGRYDASFLFCSAAAVVLMLACTALVSPQELVSSAGGGGE